MASTGGEDKGKGDYGGGTIDLNKLGFKAPERAEQGPDDLFNRPPKSWPELVGAFFLYLLCLAVCWDWNSFWWMLARLGNKKKKAHALMMPPNSIDPSVPPPIHSRPRRGRRGGQDAHRGGPAGHQGAAAPRGEFHFIHMTPTISVLSV